MTHVQGNNVFLFIVYSCIIVLISLLYITIWKQYHNYERPTYAQPIVTNDSCKASYIKNYSLHAMFLN